MKETGSPVRREQAKLVLVSSQLSKAVWVLHRAAWRLCSLEAPSCFLKLYGASEESDLGSFSTISGKQCPVNGGLEEG